MSAVLTNNLNYNSDLISGKTSYVPISVIIPFYGRINELANCLKGLFHQDFNQKYEVIVASSRNNSEMKELINFYPDVMLVCSTTVMTPGKARNLGVLNSSSDLLAFIDSDCVPSENWLSESYSALNNGNEIVVGPITNLYPFHPIASVDNLLQFIDFQKYRMTKTIKHFPACNLGITKSLFEKTNGFPEEYVTGEDILFSQEAVKICNGKILFNTKLIVKHCGRKNISGLIKHNENLGYHRGFLSLKISNQNVSFRKTFLYSFLFGLKRLVYITIRTLQWNPLGIFRIIFFFPFAVIGLAAWVKGFWKGNQSLYSLKRSTRYVKEINLK